MSFRAPTIFDRLLFATLEGASSYPSRRVDCKERMLPQVGNSETCGGLLRCIALLDERIRFRVNEMTTCKTEHLQHHHVLGGSCLTDSCWHFNGAIDSPMPTKLRQKLHPYEPAPWAVLCACSFPCAAYAISFYCGTYGTGYCRWKYSRCSVA